MDRRRERAQKLYRSFVSLARDSELIIESFNGKSGNRGDVHSGDGIPMDLDKLAQRVIRPARERVSGMEMVCWHGFRRGIASEFV